jgi:RNA polymerase subunit RPABC4/transcription elongation factor Spt4/flagellar basal body-associated protein FliL
MECPKCGKVAPDGVKFCPGCGTKLDPAPAPTAPSPSDARACPACGTPHAPDAKFCKHCGASFQGDAPASAPPEPAPPPATPAARTESASPVDDGVNVVPPPPTPEPAAPASTQPVVDNPTPTAARESFVAPAAPTSIDEPSVRSGRKGWLIGVAAVVVIVLAGAAIAYFKFAKPAPETEAAHVAPASAVSSAGVMPTAPAPATSTAIVAVSGQSSPTTAVAPTSASPQTPVVAAPAESAETSAASVAAQAAAVSPPVDRTLQMAADLVQKGERAYARGDYQTAIRHAHSALDVHPGYADAERLLKRTQAAQRRIAEQQEEEARREAAAQAEQARAAAAAQAARTPPAPTPDQIYNRRAHDECARGFFGTACRHKIRQAVCVGVSLTAPGTSVCKSLKQD